MDRLPDRRPLRSAGATEAHLNARREPLAYSLLFLASDQIDFVHLVGSYLRRVPVARRVAIAEAASRINTRIAVGNFELDFADGELRFRVSFDVQEGRLSQTMTGNMLRYALDSMDSFHGALMSVAFDNAEPAKAVAEVP